ncbi:NUDIX domain-containing protein [Paenibacillus allorhizosphaerae]|uniref:Nudix hydrolase domain-containing protein n=1 Tax=Paenibacillus allorhizosphaerae TaxID=2849866 RepID=A0ABN7TJ47_9BACL|nr:NUDIX hydrolase [Paenibacillus allorhizosphaerae]CAG7635891.1 hypothetical protein PAECIP111802_02192 [Paenibacillus allorhizosphaerae]
MTIRTRVACIAVRDNGVVLMKKLIPSYFNFNQLTPPGGGLELNETLEEACIREMYEETGLIVEQPVMKGVISYINYANNTCAVTMLFYTNQVLGDLVTKEPEKHIPEWVDLTTIRENKLVPEYYNAFIGMVLAGRPLVNARLEWNKPGAGVPFGWTVVS